MDVTAIEPTGTEQQYLDARREHHAAVQAWANAFTEPERSARRAFDRRARVYAYLIKRQRRARAAGDVVYQAFLADPRR